MYGTIIFFFLRTEGCFKNFVELNSPLDEAYADPLQTIVSVKGLRGLQFGTTGLVYG